MIRPLLLITLSLMVGTTFAQMRPDQPSVMQPPPLQSSPPIPDFAGEFRTRYAAAGKPRIMLYWNTELSARPKSDLALQDRTTATGSKTVNVVRQSSNGSFDSNSSVDGNAQAQSQRQRDISVGEKDDGKRTTTLPARDAAQFERAFDAVMRNGGAQLVDRAMAVRSTSAELGISSGKSTEDSKLVEAQALQGKADLLLQILFVPDEQAPMGYGFDVSVRAVKSGVAITSFYSQAVPPAPLARTGYVATNRGFERQTTSAIGPSVDEVATQLAFEVMNQLGPALPSVARRR